jgi:ankyrin repeat protein
LLLASPQLRNAPQSNASDGNDADWEMSQAINIHSACKRGDLGEVKQYLELGGDIEKQDGVSSLFPYLPSHLSQCGYTPLSLACYYGHAEVASLLIEKGAMLEHQDNVSDTLPFP